MCTNVYCNVETMVQKEDTLTLMDQSCPVCANNDAPRLGCVRQSLTYTHTKHTSIECRMHL